MNALVVIPCGAKKADHPAPVADLYTGSYFRGALRWARSVAPDDRIRVLSSYHGLLRLDETIAPYEMRMGDPGCVSVADVRAQASDEGLLGLAPLVAGGKAYAAVALAVWPEGRWVNAGLGGMGYHLRWFAQNARDARTR